jgi:hypothetical protein
MKGAVYSFWILHVTFLIYVQGRVGVSLWMPNYSFKRQRLQLFTANLVSSVIKINSLSLSDRKQDFKGAIKYNETKLCVRPTLCVKFYENVPIRTRNPIHVHAV